MFFPESVLKNPEKEKGNRENTMRSLEKRKIWDYDAQY
jgi:hypothetical protein